jgi:putative ABC transport system ATP-binding protein
MTTLLSIRDVRKSYGKGEAQVEALRGVSLEVAAGELVAVMGASGSGKSTLLGVTGGLEPPTSGHILIGDVVLTKAGKRELALLRRRHLGYVFQDFNLIPALTVIENVALPMELDGYSRRRAYQAAQNALEEVGVGETAKRFPDEISGGQRQRVAIARAFTGERQLLLADEPTGALDSKSGENVMRVLRQKIDNGAAGILVTHDAKCAAWADRILLLQDGLVVEESATIRNVEGLLN